ncbi:MAG TPA: hypothetical protein VF954_07435 [Acidimicrobiales bacterium]
MAIIGLLMAAAAAAFTADVAYESTGRLYFGAFNRNFSMATGWAAIVAVLIGVGGTLGLGLLFAGMRRARRRHAVVAEHQRTAAELEDDRRRLAAELDRERAARLRAEQTAPAGDPRSQGQVSAPARSSFDQMPSGERTDA